MNNEVHVYIWNDTIILELPNAPTIQVDSRDEAIDVLLETDKIFWHTMPSGLDYWPLVEKLFD